MRMENKLESYRGGQEDYNWEEKKRKIAEKLDFIINNPIKEQYFEEIRSFGSLEATKKLENHCIFVNTITEFAEILRQIKEKYPFLKDWADETLKHENAHALISNEVNFKHSGYRITFIETKNGVLGFKPTYEDISNSCDPEERKKRLKVLKISNSYGSEMSDDDKQKIENLISKN